jgi:hypothetical protein
MKSKKRLVGKNRIQISLRHQWDRTTSLVEPQACYWNLRLTLQASGRDVSTSTSAEKVDVAKERMTFTISALLGEYSWTNGGGP